MKYSLKLSLCLVLLLTAYGALAAKGEQKVAVLPFSVHSAESIDYVKQGIWDMLSSRIAVTDKIEVISKDSVLQAMKGKEGKDLAIQDIYGLGKKMNADFVVYGSITKFGNSISIDGKLVDIAANKSTVSLFTQSQGMDEVMVKINDFARNIDNHILGTVPPSFAPPVAAAQAPAPQQQAPQDSREYDIIGEMKRAREAPLPLSLTLIS